MKKNYISPTTESILLSIQTILQASITYDGDAPKPEVGGDAGDGEGGDSRRHRDMWEDEEEDY
ncbi:MAG: hypothetical protein II949_11305 [Prevotella sp.]|nr:hypothetical protein [Prevotella sp.]